jgi:hypothetical protein
MKRLLSGWFLVPLVAGCGSAGSPSAAPPDPDAGIVFVPDDDAGDVPDAFYVADVPDAQPAMLVDGAYILADGAPVPASRFVTKVVSFTPGDCAGFGIPSMPGIVMGPPVGGGAQTGSTDVVSLGNGGTIVVSFEPNAIVDGPGVDLIVFENPFDYGNGHIYGEPGEVSVSDDGITWKTFPCAATNATCETSMGCPQCGGWHVVYSTPENGISPLDPAVAGGDPYDLADLGVTHARYVRVVDKSAEACAPPPNGATTNGFDLDAMAIVNAALP